MRIGDWLEPNNLRPLFVGADMIASATADLRKDLSFLRVAARTLIVQQARPPRPYVEPFPAFRPLHVPALAGKRVGLVASGGSGALASLCGVRRAFEEAGIEVAGISACSGAMLFASLWAAGASAAEMARFWLERSDADYIDPSWRRLAVGALHRFRRAGGLLQGNAVEQLIRSRVGAMTLAETPIPLSTVAWNIDRNRVEHIGTRQTPKLPLATAVRVAISIPVLVEPVRLGEHYYGDGGIVDIFPAAALLDDPEPFDVVFGVNCYYPYQFSGESIDGWYDRSFAILRAAGQLRYSGHLELARAQCARLGDKLVLMHPVSYADVRGAQFYEAFLDRSLWGDYMRQGYDCTRNTLERMASGVAQLAPRQRAAR